MSEIGIQLLLTRLLWPSLLVRERAASELVKLLRDPEQRGKVSDQFLEWMRSLEFESLAANALLIPLRLKRDGISPFPTLESLTDAISHPSILSETILTALGADISKPDWTLGLHSGSPPAGFQIDSYFSSYVKTFVPPVYDLRAQRLEARWGIPFRRQWAYEWNIVRHRAQLGYSEPPHYFLSARAQAGNAYFDTLQSEAFRSGFLRALAWAVDDAKVDAGTLELLALTCCPLDMALWSVTAGPVPLWWPRVAIRDDVVDTAAAEILEAVQQLWQRGSQDSKTRLVYAAGRVATSQDVIYAVEIRSTFQRSLGAERPDLSEVEEFLKNDNVISTLPPGLAIEGVVQSAKPGEHAGGIGDWSLLRVVFRLDPWVVPRWQAPHMYYGCPVLAPYLAPARVTVGSRSNMIVLSAGDSTVCETYFWHNLLREVDVREVPPRTGVYMLANSEIIEEFSRRNNAALCWLVTLHLYHRETSGEFKSSSTHFFLGASNVILPF